MAPVLLLLLAAGLLSANAALDPKVETAARVDAIVVVAGVKDDRYVHARRLAESGISDRILVSRPPTFTGRYATAIDSYCDTTPVTRDGRIIGIECFTPDFDTTEGEATAASRIARERGYESLQVVTYWGHVSRVRTYFEQCFDGNLYVTDTPEPIQISRARALLHETGGYVKTFIRPAC
ncbi:DUF218 domain-containing protein [Dietzia maris]|nr:ElyC/SanA/YdcF family protein [Dietzia maris]MBB0996453.1 DUF218 domain-containing protein [Dietzia maris]